MKRLISRMPFLALVWTLAGASLLSSCGPKPPAPAATEVKKEGGAGILQDEDLRKNYAGILFGTPVPVGNYYFARRVHLTFQRPEEIKMPPEAKERLIWENLALSFQAAKKEISVTPEELDQWIDSVLGALDAKVKRSDKPAYEKFVTETIKEPVELFENQMRYLATIEKMKREKVKEMKVTVSDEEIREEYMNVQNHVGGEFLLFPEKAGADAFFQEHTTQESWEAVKKQDAARIKTFPLMTVQAIVDLWGVPQEQINRFHALPLGTVGEPMPFGNQWGVFRLMEKREGQLKDLVGEELEGYRKRVEIKKQYKARDEWLQHLYEEAAVKSWMPLEELESKPAEEAAAAAPASN